MDSAIAFADALLSDGWDIGEASVEDLRARLETFFEVETRERAEANRPNILQTGDVQLTVHADQRNPFMFVVGPEAWKALLLSATRGEAFSLPMPQDNFRHDWLGLWEFETLAFTADAATLHLRRTR